MTTETETPAVTIYGDPDEAAKLFVEWVIRGSSRCQGHGSEDINPNGCGICD